MEPLSKKDIFLPGVSDSFLGSTFHFRSLWLARSELLQPQNLPWLILGDDWKRFNNLTFDENSQASSILQRPKTLKSCIKHWTCSFEFFLQSSNMLTYIYQPQHMLNFESDPNLSDVKPVLISSYLKGHPWASIASIQKSGIKWPTKLQPENTPDLAIPMVANCEENILLQGCWYRC